MPQAAPGSWVQRLTLLVLSTALMLGLTEGTLQLINYPPSFFSAHDRLFIEYDSLRGWRNIPGSSGYVSTPEFRVFLSYNSRGIRGPERPYSKPDSTYRILLLGDSFVDAYSIPLDERVAELAQRLIADSVRSPRIEVIALGTVGYSTDQELLWLESEGIRYQPDLVVLMFYSNDVWYNARPQYPRGSKPMFTLIDGGGLRLTHLPVRPQPVSGGAAPLDRARRWIRNQSKLGLLTQQALENTTWLVNLADRLGGYDRGGDVLFDQRRGFSVHGETSVFLKDPPPETIHAWKVTEALVERIRETVEGSRGTLVVFFVPPRWQIYPGELRRSERSMASAIDGATAERWFLAMCSRKALQCLDPTEAFRGAADSLGHLNQRLYHVHDVHWNRNGHRLAAQILADFVRSE